jgi:hypothetical protein
MRMALLQRLEHLLLPADHTQCATEDNPRPNTRLSTPEHRWLLLLYDKHGSIPLLAGRTSRICRAPPYQS